MSVITLNIANSFQWNNQHVKTILYFSYQMPAASSALDKLPQGWQDLLGAYLETPILKPACFKLWGALLWKRARRLWEE